MKAPLLVICPFKAEARLLAAILPDCQKLNSSEWSFSGGYLATPDAAGGEALLALARAWQQKITPARATLFGSAGALVEQMSVGELYVCTTLHCEEQRLSLPAQTCLPEAVSLTTDVAVTARSERQRLAVSSGAKLVNMEDYHFASFLLHAKIAGTIIRFISDTSEQQFSLPFGQKIREAILLHRHEILKLISFGN